MLALGGQPGLWIERRNVVVRCPLDQRLASTLLIHAPDRPSSCASVTARRLHPIVWPVAPAAGAGPAPDRGTVMVCSASCAVQ